MQQLSIDDFTPWLNEACDMAFDGGQVPMTLVKAEPLEGGVRGAGAFRLEFLGPASPVLAQATMAVRRADFDHEIFIVPIASDAAGTHYEAVFY